MRRFVAILMALAMIFALCACGKEEVAPVARECGVYVTVEANDVYAVSYGTEEGSESCEHADKTPLDAGEIVHFDFAGDAAASSQKAVIDYSICIYDKDLNVLAIESFSSDFSNMARVEITVTADHRILNASDKLVCGGDTVVDIKSENPSKGVTVATPNVTMPNRPEAAKAINDNISGINEAFTGKQFEANKKAYETNTANAKDDDKTDSFSMKRYTKVTRGDNSVLSIRMYDKANLGTESSIAITGHNFNTYDGSELKLIDIASEPEKLISICSEDILISTTENSNYKDILYNEGYTDTIQELISDGHWYLNDKGLVVAVNPGEIADADYGYFEFLVSYDILSPVLKPEYLPAQYDGDSGDISAKLTKDSDTASLTLVNDADKDVKSVLVSVTGKIYNISVYSITYKSASKYTLNSQLWYCSDLTEGAAFAINHELSKTPNMLIGFNRPDGTYERRILSLDSDGNVSITDPDGGEKGTLISEKLPYTVDLNSDETKEKINTSAMENGCVSLTVESSGEKLSKDTVIKNSLNIRLFDIDSNGTKEIFVDGKNADGKYVTYCFVYDGELKAVSIGGKDYAEGSVKEFNSSKLHLNTTVSILGSYTAEVIYNYADGSFTKDSGNIKLSGTSYVTTEKELPLADGKTLPADTKLKFTETDGSSFISYTTEKGDKGKIKIEKSDSGWNINGSKDTSYFESLPYKK